MGIFQTTAILKKAFTSGLNNCYENINSVIAIKGLFLRIGIEKNSLSTRGTRALARDTKEWYKFHISIYNNSEIQKLIQT
ncbi:hypothetical protein BH23BAC1_BH23BAC1_07440 [soil metagenome]